MSNKRLVLEIKNDFSELECLFDNLQDFGHELGISGKTLFHVSLALEELVANIISYGYTDCLEHSIRLTVSYEKGVLYFRVEDDGIPFDPTEADSPDCHCPIEERSVGKLGIHLTRELMDDLAYEREGGRNILTFTKRVEE